MASAPGVIGVAHWLRDGSQNQSFQYGTGIDLAAPAQVETADPATAVNTNLHAGTSFSAPHVTGAVAAPAGRVHGTRSHPSASGGDFGGPRLTRMGRPLGRRCTRRRPCRHRTAVHRRDFSGAEPITVPGGHTLTANIVNGAPPFTVTWSVTYSDPLGARVIFGSRRALAGRMSVPAGRYTITVRATPRESVYGRNGARRRRGFRCVPTPAAGRSWVELFPFRRPAPGRLRRPPPAEPASVAGATIFHGEASKFRPNLPLAPPWSVPDAQAHGRSRLRSDCRRGIPGRRRFRRDRHRFMSPRWLNSKELLHLAELPDGRVAMPSVGAVGAHRRPCDRRR